MILFTLFLIACEKSTEGWPLLRSDGLIGSCQTIILYIEFNLNETNQRHLQEQTGGLPPRQRGANPQEKYVNPKSPRFKIIGKEDEFSEGTFLLMNILYWTYQLLEKFD